jgi:2'-5' RNA ligase
MRLFFALRPAQGCADALAALADRLAPITGGRPVARGNLHLTLLFLGALDARAAAAAADAGDAAAAAWHRAGGREVDGGRPEGAIRIPLDTLGRFHGARVAWIGPVTIPPPLTAFHTALRDAVGAAGVGFDRRPFAPHVTLLRKALHTPPPDMLQAALVLCADRFALMRSDSGPDGVVYRPVRCWPLR